ncbi:MAG: hypothetical protein ACPGID_04315 [Rubricella sp.]
MWVVHRGFDTLTLAIKASIGPELLSFLEAEKEAAEAERETRLITYGGQDFHLRPYGGNGYSFILQAGRDGASWFFKKPNRKDPWGTRVSVGSFFLANRGLGAAKAHIERTLDRLGIRYQPDDVSIARVDFCVDILAPHFVLDPDCFVMHSGTRRRDFLDGEPVAVNGKSGRVTSVTVGRPSARQVIVYDKRAEVIGRQKAYWWEIWNGNLAARGENLRIGPKSSCASLRGDKKSQNGVKNPPDRVWRIEFRAGKDVLRGRWNIRTWADLFDRYGDLCRSTGELIRYCDPRGSDKNRSRWPNHPIWDIACAEINDDLLEMRSGCDPAVLKEVDRMQHISLILRNIVGNGVTLAALEGQEPDELPDWFLALGERMRDTVEDDPERAAMHLAKAKERYVFVSAKCGR